MVLTVNLPFASVVGVLEKSEPLEPLEQFRSFFEKSEPLEKFRSFYERLKLQLSRNRACNGRIRTSYIKSVEGKTLPRNENQTKWATQMLKKNTII
ncbi:hypothetical protein ACFX1X_034499 [Malus domestica]